MILQFVLVDSSPKFGGFWRKIVVAIRKLAPLQASALALAIRVASIDKTGSIWI